MCMIKTKINNFYAWSKTIKGQARLNVVIACFLYGAAFKIAWDARTLFDLFAACVVTFGACFNVILALEGTRWDKL
jgi:hypothetical protein